MDRVPNLNDLSNLVGFVWARADDKDAVEQIGRETMRSFEPGASDGGDAAVRSHHDERSQIRFEGAVEEGEALNVEHVDFVYEENLGGIRQTETAYMNCGSLHLGQCRLCLLLATRQPLC